MSKCIICSGDGWVVQDTPHGAVNVKCSQCEDGEAISMCPVCGECFIGEDQLKEHLDWIKDHAEKQTKIN